MEAATPESRYPSGEGGQNSLRTPRGSRLRGSYDVARRLGRPALIEFHYVYILVTVDKPTRHYVGRTANLEARLKQHNHGQVPHTAKHRPWRLETAISFRSEAKAVAFERYLKSGSGREFARRHF